MKLGRTAAGILAGAFIVASLALPASAQQPKKFRTVSYTAVSDGSGIRFTLGPSDEVDRGGAVTQAEVRSKPRAMGSAAGILGQEDTTVSTKAPPDDAEKTAAGTGAPQPFGPFSVSGQPWTASSKSEAEDGSPSTVNTATFGDFTIGGEGADLLGAMIEVSSTETRASAQAKGKNVTSTASSKGVIITLSLSTEALQGQAEAIQPTLCGGLAQQSTPLGDACNAAFTSTQETVEFLKLEVGEGVATCTWDGKTPNATGSAATITPTVLGVQLAALSPTSEPLVLGDTTALATTIGAGTFSKETDDAGDNGTDKVDAIAGGAYATLLGGSASFRFSTSTCSIAAPISTDEVLAATGSVVLWYLLGGAGLVAAALGLRRFLRLPA